MKGESNGENKPENTRRHPAGVRCSLQIRGMGVQTGGNRFFTSDIYSPWVYLQGEERRSEENVPKPKMKSSFFFFLIFWSHKGV